MDTRIWDQVSLELSNIDVQGTIESERRGEGRDDLGNQSVQVGVGGTLDVQVTTADVVQSLVIDLVGDVGVLQERVHTEHGVVGLDNSGGDLRARPHGEGDLGLLAVVDGETYVSFLE